jgi:PASTA domain
VSRPSFDPPGSPQGSEWQQLIESRIWFWRDTRTGVDVSLRNYIRTISHGRADVDGEVLPVYTLDRQDVPPGFLASQFEQSLRDQGFDAAALVMNGGFGAGTSQFPGFWARFAMVEGVGVWMMELTHVLTYFADLYTNDRAHDLNTFDNMDCSCGTHPTAYTKVQLGWLDPSAITTNATATTAQYDLYTVGLPQPPPAGRHTAVQTDANGQPIFVEARQKVDQYDGGNQWSWNDLQNRGGIASEGVIVYQLVGVQNPNPFAGEIDPLIRLLTQTALVPGQSVTSTSGVTVEATAALVGGFRVTIRNPTPPSVVVPDVFELRPAFAKKEIEDAGLVARFTGPNQQNAWVSHQSPLAGHVVARGTTVTMVLRTGPVP